jgi:hypothetical protein
MYHLERNKTKSFRQSFLSLSAKLFLITSISVFALKSFLILGQEVVLLDISCETGLNGNVKLHSSLFEADA